jgi:transporter family-2 protein
VKVLLALFVVAVGAILPLQAGINAELRRHLGHPLLAAVVNFLVGILALASTVAIAGVRMPALAEARAAPPWAWAGGLCGATLVVTAVVAAPRLGAVVLVAGLVVGQLVASVLIDHFGWVGFPVRPISAARVLGIVLLTGGLLLVQRSA